MPFLTFNTPTQMQDILPRYLRYLKLQRSMSPNTIEAYRRDVEKLITYLNGEGKTLTQVELSDLQAFAAGLHDIGIGPRSQCRILSGVRSLYRFMVQDGYLDQDPTELLESPVLGEHLPEFLTPQEVDQLEAALKDAGKDYEFHRYDGAGHGIWYYHNAMYRQEAAMDGWNKTLAFFDKNLK